MSIDILAVGAHPDDVDLGVGGTILALADQGYRVGILDLTRGELASRGTVEERKQEAELSKERLGASMRLNAGLPDGAIANVMEQRSAVISIIRSLRPRVLLCHHGADRHPDHVAAHTLLKEANFYAGVASIRTEHEPYRAETVYYYRPYYEDSATPAFIMDISKQFDRKYEALKAFGSQLYNPDYSATDTWVSGADFWEDIQTRAAYWGHRIGVNYGEPLYADSAIGLTELPGLEKNP